VARLQEQKVVYLAPTLALVNQVATDVRKTFPETRTTEADELEPEDLTNIAVMTPERCLTLLGFSPEVFENVGLLVFDECHLMHPREGASRRSVDAMLCLLAFLRAAPAADVLLISAMINNAVELAKWLGELTGRHSLPLTLNWKPTRQARGCVVYPSDRIKELNLLLRTSARSSLKKSIPKAVKDQLDVQPLGMFSLLQTWQTRDEKDYTLLPILNDTILLDATKKIFPGNSLPSTYLTSNRNAVAAAIAARSGDLGIKTLVFAQTIPFCLSIQKKTEELMGRRTVVLTREEDQSKIHASIELGSEDCTYCKADGLVASHHGLLLPIERQFNESLFRRSDGVHVLVATSTLAQGMNLPSQMVVIAGDDRFDVELSKIMLLEAHELLNAAGRAGRAGEAAEGMVILVPGKVIAYDELKTTMSRHWFALQELFSNSDQCLKLEDPIEPILDRIHQSAAIPDPDAMYLLRRLPIKIGEGEESARQLLSRSFGAFRRRQSGDDGWIVARVESAMIARRHLTALTEIITWEDELAATAGVLNAEHIRSIAAALDEISDIFSMSTAGWIQWGLDWLAGHPTAFAEVVRAETIIGVFGKALEGFQTDARMTQAILDKIREALPLWIGGTPLIGIESVLTKKHSKKCDAGREWSIRLAPELAYFFGLIPQVYRRLKEAKGGLSAILASAVPLSFVTLGRCVREGFDHPDKVALHQLLGATVPRVVIHQDFALISHTMAGGRNYEAFPDAVKRVRIAWKQRTGSN
jgi:superfamily II DNA/RNA helicase